MNSLAWALGRDIRRRVVLRRVLSVASALVLLWLGGFAWFVHRAVRPEPPPPGADGIVVLTGGADRIRHGLRLLSEHEADHLLVTGIGGHAGLAALAHHAGIDPAPLANQVTLGRGAQSTRGNAREIAAWAKANDFHSLIVVTAFYHMPRALAEIGAAVPGVTLYASPVTPSGSDEDTEGLRLLLEEYVKYLAAKLGLSALKPSAPPMLAAARLQKRE